ncbi:peptide/nickel transport system permease protein [Actinoplanes tereljensis]|uniref:Peptide ABC transporter permease n=1 Tax=Paractinoplanes tereljensis TaxID=571912 RepID=A0A919TUM2_9ACTN|nr:ABC transporter permease [Actinoplanes tereljensis]GIF23838.1 peptide ABC transporter permease [Actinoplanes tereljensis]
MIGFLTRRAGAAVAVLLILTAVVFVLQQYSPGDPVKAYLGANASPAAVAAERVTLHLDDPLVSRYGHYLSAAARGDLGTSYRTHRKVTADLGAFLPATFELVVVAFLFALLLGAVFAMLRTIAGTFVRGVLLVGATAPPFLLALGGIILFYAHLGWLPATGRGGNDDGFLLTHSLVTGDWAQFGDGLQHVVLPALVLAVAPAVSIGRILRASLQQTLSADHVRTARAKGLTEVAVFGRHVLRNSIGPGLSMAGLQLGFMFAGVVVVEQIFSWPGIGNYLAESIPAADYPAIAGVTVVLGAVYIVTNTVVDMIQALADPRIAL